MIKKICLFNEYTCDPETIKAKRDRKSFHNKYAPFHHVGVAENVKVIAHIGASCRTPVCSFVCLYVRLDARSAIHLVCRDCSNEILMLFL